MTDITEHKWSDDDIEGVSVCVDTTRDKDLLIHVKGGELVLLKQSDSIAIAKHFYQSLSTHERIEFIATIRGEYKLTITGRAQVLGDIVQSERTYKSLNMENWNQSNSLDNIGIKKDD